MRSGGGKGKQNDHSSYGGDMKLGYKYRGLSLSASYGYDKTRKVEITECQSYERCMNVRKILMEKFGFRNVVILKAHGISTLYENAGGIVLAF